MTKYCKKCDEEFNCTAKKCPVCGARMKDVYTEEELAEIQKQNDDMTAISTINSMMM
jgi:predicted amidophosphoribosyltransferase